MSEKLYTVISKVFSVPISVINDESGPETIESWDSFNILILVDELENNFNIKFSVSEIIDIKNVKNIKRHLKNHDVVYIETTSYRHSSEKHPRITWRTNQIFEF